VGVRSREPRAMREDQGGRARGEDEGTTTLEDQGGRGATDKGERRGGWVGLQVSGM
jgi:hypothetical protein